MYFSDLGNVTHTSHKVIVSRTIVLSDADIKSNSIGYLSYGSRLVVLQSLNNFVQIEFDQTDKITGSNTGYLYKNHINKIDFFHSEWVQLTESFIGTPINGEVGVFLV